MSDQQAHHQHMTNRLYQQQKQQLPISENVPQKLTQFKEKDGGVRGNAPTIVLASAPSHGGSVAGSLGSPLGAWLSRWPGDLVAVWGLSWEAGLQ